MSRVLVTGSQGFAGRHLVTALQAAGHEVVGLARQAPERAAGPVEVADLRDEAAVRQVVERVRPEVVYHLAAIASVRESSRQPMAALSANFLGTAALLYAIVDLIPEARVLVVTSSEVYGAPAGGAPLIEEAPPAPRNADGVSKLAVHHLARQLHETAGLQVVEARPFNHLGPGQRLGFVAPDFASQIAAVVVGRQAPVLRVGDLSAERDFTDVRDIVQGYVRLAEAGTPGGVYHLCSGQPTPIRSLLETLINLSGAEVTIATDPARQRPNDIPRVIGSAAKIHRELAWAPTRNLRETLGEILDEWLGRASGRETNSK